MKQKQRHQLKENELAHTVAAVGGFVVERKRQLTIVGIVIGAIILAGFGYLIVRQQTDSKSHALLAAAMTIVEAPVQPPTPAEPPSKGKPGTMEQQAPGTYPTEEAKLKAAMPKLKEAADGYPDSEAGITARYHLAATQAALGNHKDAVTTYDEVARRAGENSLYGRMAKLGKATEQVRLGQYQPAIDTYKTLADQKDSEIPADAVLLQLARAYAASGNQAEARKAFSRIVHEHPGSPYSSEAGKELQ